MKPFSQTPIRKPSAFIAVFISMLTYYSILISAAQNSGETIVKVDPSTISVDKGEKFTVNVTVIDVQNLYGVEIVVRWNASLLQLVSVDIRLGVNSHPDGVLYEPFMNITQENIGEYLIAATSYTPAPPFNGSGNIIRMTFQAIDDGESVIDLETKLYDYPPPDREPRESLPIPHTTIDGNVTIIPEFSNMIIPVMVLILVTVILTLLTRNQKRLNFVKRIKADIEEKASLAVSSDE
ncbi:MAG: cohesin domain-containing protein [Candidatus Bathyarchaeia archaeon]